METVSDLDELLLGAAYHQKAYYYQLNYVPYAEGTPLNIFVHFMSDELRQNDASNYGDTQGAMESMFGYFTWQRDVGINPLGTSIGAEGTDWTKIYGYINVVNMVIDELKEVARENLDAARQMLMDILSNYQGFKKNVVILVFDAYKVPRSVQDVTRYHNIYVVYTKEAETADAYIERATYEIGKHHKVRVATSDGAEQLIILGHGALRLSASTFKAEVEGAAGQIAAILKANNRAAPSKAVAAALEKAKRKQEGTP